MGVNRSVFYFDDSGSPSAGGNVGPLNVSSMSKLYLFRVRGSILGGWGSVPAGAANNNLTFMGIQWVSHGDSPVDLVSGANSANYLWVGQVQTDSTSTWAPTTGDGEFASWVPIDIEWRGQFPLGSDIDFYFSTAQTIGSGGTWAVSGNMEVNWT